MTALVGAVALLALAGGVAGHDATDVTGTYAIQNVQTGKNLRPWRAGNADGNAIVLYEHWRWKCMTWQFVRVSGETYRLINRYTGKTLQPAAAPASGVALLQQTSGAPSLQEWDFVKQPGNTYLMRLKGNDLYVTASSTDTNSPIVLMPKQDGDAQQWRLVAQDPWF